MNYKVMVIADVVKFLDANPLAKGLSQDDLYNLLYDEPLVVDVGDLIDSDKLYAMIIENIDLALDACKWLGIDDLEKFKRKIGNGSTKILEDFYYRR